MPDDRSARLRETVSDYALVFGSAQGKRVLADLMSLFAERSSYVPGDAHGTSFKEGERNVVLTIQRRVFLGKNPKELDRLLTPPAEEGGDEWPRQ